VRRVVKALLFLFLIASPAWAIDSFQLPEDPQLLARYQALSEEFRCLVCQNQNLADSNAELAKDLKIELVELLQAGKNDEQIREFLVARYGDFVLYRPPVNSATAFLWLAPLIAVSVLGLVVLMLWRRGRQTETATANDEQVAAALADLKKQKNS
jgi:cytochrome c-type biogenesis protein CcmH